MRREIMKKITILTLILLLVFSGAAIASEYVVQSGDTLSKIAKVFYGSASKQSYMKIAKANGIVNPHHIYVNQKLNIPELETSNERYSPIKAIFEPQTENPFQYKNPGGNKYKDSKNPERVKFALKGLRYPEGAIDGLMVKVANRRFEWITIARGDMLAGMAFGQDRFEFDVLCDWGNEKGRMDLLSAKEYLYEYEGVLYRLIWIVKCGNWSRGYEKKLSEPPLTPPLPELVIAEEVPPPEIPKLKCQKYEHEPVIWTGAWRSDASKGRYIGGEYVLWKKVDCKSPYSIGIGVYGNWDDGESKFSDYEWNGRNFGPQIGVKKYWLERDKDSRKDRANQWIIKLRLVYEEAEGKNSSSGYNMEQDNWKVGLYVERTKEFTDKWLGGLVAEGWYGFDEEIKSTWSGDSPSDRGTVSVGGFAQYKINEDWQTRGNLAVFYQEWDDMFGLHLRVELRWKEIIMFGPYSNLFVFGKSSVYDGISASDLHSYGVFVRVELGPIIRHQMELERMKKLQKLDNEAFGVIYTTAPTQAK